MSRRHPAFDPQEMLDDALSGTARVLVRRRDRRDSGLNGGVVLTLGDPHALEGLQQVLRIRRVRRCALHSKGLSTELEFLDQRGRTLAAIDVYDDASVLCHATRDATLRLTGEAADTIDGSAPIAQLEAGDFLELSRPGHMFDWFSAHGVNGASRGRRTYLRGQARERQRARVQRAIERAWWALALPDVRHRRRALTASSDAVRLAALSATQFAVQHVVRSRPEDVLGLLRWLGAGGDAPWGSGGRHAIPERQSSVPLALLISLDLSVLLDCVTRLPEEPLLLEGAVRLFGALQFRKAHPQGLPLLPMPVRKRLLDHGLSGENPHRRFIARKAFEFLGGPVPWD